MFRLSIVSAVVILSSPLSCTTVDADEGPIPSAKRAAEEAAADQAQNPGPATHSDRALKEAEPVRLRFKEDLFRFHANTENFTGASKAKVKALGKILTTYQENWERLEIRGHSDANSKNPQRNQELSELRAKAVLDVFAGAGVDSGRMSSEGYGASEPLPGKDPKAPENRRVEIILYGTSHEGELFDKLKNYLLLAPRVTL